MNTSKKDYQITCPNCQGHGGFVVEADFENEEYDSWELIDDAYTTEDCPMCDGGGTISKNYYENAYGKSQKIKANKDGSLTVTYKANA